MEKKAIFFTLLIVSLLVFYYSWLPDPNMKSEAYLPKWILDWSNKNYNLRTGVPFVPFGYFLAAYSQMMNSDKPELNTNLIFIQNLGVAGIVAFIAEGGQFLIQSRNPDLMDIYFAIIGSAVGAFTYSLVNKIRFKNAK
ncbi:VanZ like family protein [Flavobacterium flevense]|uniref:VanZ-like domain-containing protein n=1 Tax=Flavobacterium flevense TaxID=983 RepID=A0A4Y4AVS7_9FLAO|nr:hypothetical protein [Flavobacterium flevense]GEC72331.1 hypothetical protein FFL01_18700 [Flavobacterium flevense]SHM08333.1 VanZ like family protein [Flavobacterium flevense]